MGARVARMFRNFNLENRVHREITRDKPRVAPRHPHTTAPSAAAPSPDAEGAADSPTPSVHDRNAPLLDHLRTLYVESTDPEGAPQSSRPESAGPKAERRPLKYSVPLEQLGLLELTDVPKGKLTLAEALKALSSHQQQPGTWTAERIAQEYSLKLTDTKAVLDFFIPFRVQIITPASQTKQIKDS